MPLNKPYFPIFKMIIILSIIILVMLCFKVCDKRKFCNGYKFTVGVITSTESHSEGCGANYLKFNVNSVVYHSSMSDCNTCTESYYKIGDKVFIQFDPNDPNKNECIGEICVPDTLINIPENGWNKLPVSNDMLSGSK